MHRMIRPVLAALIFTAVPLQASSRLEVVPSTFDFGWAPDNAKITSEFILRNTGQEVVPLTSIIPSCGCTAADFTPGNVGSKEERKFSLTFNTRGFVNQPFEKSSRIGTEDPKVRYVAVQKGHITNTSATLYPDGDGVAGFPDGSQSRKKTFSIINNTGEDVELVVVQAPASWATVDLPSSPIRKGSRGTIEVSVTGPLSENRNTSVTLAPAKATDKNRFTLAIFTGQGNPPYKINPANNPRPQAQPAAVKPAPSTAQPAKKVPPVPAQKVPPKADSLPAPKN